MSAAADRYDDAFLTAAQVTRDLLRLPQLAPAWGEPSALPGLSVGALACHLGNQVVRAAQLLPQQDDLPVLGSVDEHYRRAAWVTAPPDDAVNDRSRDEDEARAGHAALLDRVDGADRTVRALLADGSARDVVPVPWQGWSLCRDDFLLTRMLEMVVHSDDLVASLDVPAPTLPDAVLDPVVALLVRLSVARHGQSALVATLTRRERAREIYAF